MFCDSFFLEIAKDIIIYKNQSWKMGNDIQVVVTMQAIILLKGPLKSLINSYASYWYYTDKSDRDDNGMNAERNNFTCK